tara:strand:- start:262 stop:423 length:162 start_codon:yes stop_codon:yes gene_type:complete
VALVNGSNVLTVAQQLTAVIGGLVDTNQKTSRHATNTEVMLNGKRMPPALPKI